MSNPTTENQIVRDLDIISQVHNTIVSGAKPHLVLPEGFKATDLEHLLPAPVRTKHSPKFNEPESFIRYVKEFSKPGTKIYASEKAKTFTGTIDHDTPDTTAWREHRPELHLTLTPEWEAWIGANKRPFGQVEFAEFIEERAKEITTPTSAAMTEVALTLNARRDIGIKSAHRLDNGAMAIVYDESIRATTDGNVEIPTQFKITISPFKGLQPFELNCFLRYRLNDKSLSFHYSIQFWEKAVEQAFKDIVKMVGEGTGFAPLLTT